MTALEWFSYEGSSSHRAPHITDSFTLLLAIQMLVTVAGGIQIRMYAWEQGQCVFSHRSPAACSTQTNHSSSNRTDSSTIARLTVWTVMSHAIISIFK